MNRFDGKSIIVTGAGSGIGRATARRFAAEGGKVIAADKMPTVHETVELITSDGGTAIGVEMDAGSESRGSGTGRESRERTWRVWMCCFANAGITGGLPGGLVRCRCRKLGGSVAGEPDRPIPRDQIWRAGNRKTRRWCDHLYRIGSRYPFGRWPLFLFGIQGRGHQPGDKRPRNK